MFLFKVGMSLLRFIVFLAVVSGVTSLRAPVNLCVFQPDRVSTIILGGGVGGGNDVGSCLGRVVV